MSYVSLADVEAAQKRIAPYIRETPMILADYVNARDGVRLVLKSENLQATGSFKVRGAANCVLSNLAKAKSSGVVAASAGNHAQGVARICRELSIDAVIVMPQGTPPIKVQNTQRFGARVELVGQVYDDSSAHAHALAESEGRLLVPPFRDPLVVAGQGTAALEMIADPLFEGTEAVVIPIGGGGLGVGCATVLREKFPKVRLYGVTPENAPTFYQAFRTGVITEEPVRYTIAEGTAMKRSTKELVGEARRLFDDIFSVSEESIAHAISLHAEHGKTIVEGSGALPLAAYLEKRFSEKNATLLVSGGNIDLPTLSLVLQRGLALQSRLVRYKVRLPDRPGSLLLLTQLLADRAANVLQVHHARSTLDLPFGETLIEFEIETRGPEHTKTIEDALIAKNFRFRR